MFNMNKLTGAALGASLFMGVWGAPAIANDMSSAESYRALIQAAVDNPLRDDKDRERDTGRKPAKIIEFMGIKPGMTVMEMLAGSGYYAEILSHVVGETGKVIALNNKSYMAFTKDAIVTRLEQPGRMENVDLKIAEINEMDLKKDNLDAVFLVLSYHDFYFVDEESGWPKVDVKRTLGQIHGALKQGGTLAVIDHAAAAGSPRETGSTLHRIDPAIVRTELEAAGFELVATSDVLANPQDDLSKPMYDKSVRGKTHRFVYRFVKK